MIQGASQALQVGNLRLEMARYLERFRRKLSIDDEVWHLDDMDDLDGIDGERADFSGTYTIIDFPAIGQVKLKSDYYGVLTVLEEMIHPKGDGTRLCMRTGDGAFDDQGREWIETYCMGRQLRAHALMPNTNPVTHRVCNLCQMKKWGEVFL